MPWRVLLWPKILEIGVFFRQTTYKCQILPFSKDFWHKFSAQKDDSSVIAAETWSKRLKDGTDSAFATDWGRAFQGLITSHVH